MNLKRIIIAVAALTLFSVGPLAAHTILIDTSTPRELGDLESDSRIVVVSAESGVMDMLFDGGHIFFNVYTVTGNGGSGADVSESLNLGTEIGADYVLMLDPRDEGLYWNLYRTEDRTALADGGRDLGEVDADLPLLEKWTALGQLVAGDILSMIG